MSERTDRIKACVTSDWKTTRQIVEDAGYDWEYTNQKCAIRILISLSKFGKVEKRWKDIKRGGVRSQEREWRCRT